MFRAARAPSLSEPAARARQTFEIPVLLAALAVVPVMVIEERWTSDGWQALAAFANWATWAVFVVEYATVVTLAEDRWRYTRSAWLDVAVIVVSFPLLPALTAVTRLARLARLARVLQLLHLMNLAAVVTRAGNALRAVLGSHGLMYLVAGTATLVLSFGAMFAIVEPDVGSFSEGLWWAVVTVTTVGYGDVTPATPLGRLTGATLMLVGVGFVAATTAAVAARFVVEDEEEVMEETHEIRARMDSVQEQLDRIEAALARIQVGR